MVSAIKIKYDQDKKHRGKFTPSFVEYCL